MGSEAGQNATSDRAATARIGAFLDGGPNMVFQPIANLYTGRVIGFESLARFTDDRTPDLWFKEAARVGLGLPLELAAIRAALRSIGELPAGAYLAINVSPETAASPALVAALEGNPVDRVLLEITEHARVEDYQSLDDALAGLRARGMRVAIDDVGAGFSTLAHVLKIKPDVIKLDRELVSEINRDPGRSALVRSLAEFARSIGSSVVAEGVETPQEAAALRALGIASGQGYHIGRPAPSVTGPAARHRAIGAARIAREFLRGSRNRRVRRRLVAAMLLALVVASPSFMMMTANAEPGSALWGARLVMERARIALAIDPAKDVKLRLEFADQRAGELGALFASGADPALIARVAADMQANWLAAIASLDRIRTTNAHAALSARAADLIAADTAALRRYEERFCAARAVSASCRSLRRGRDASGRAAASFAAPSSGRSSNAEPPARASDPPAKKTGKDGPARSSEKRPSEPPGAAKGGPSR